MVYKEQKVLMHGGGEGDYGFEAGKDVAAIAEKMIRDGRIAPMEEV